MVNSGGSANEWTRFMLMDMEGDQAIMIGHTESDDYADVSQSSESEYPW